MMKPCSVRYPKSGAARRGAAPATRSIGPSPWAVRPVVDHLGGRGPYDHPVAPTPAPLDLQLGDLMDAMPAGALVIGAPLGDGQEIVVEVTGDGGAGEQPNVVRLLQLRPHVVLICTSVNCRWR